MNEDIFDTAVPDPDGGEGAAQSVPSDPGAVPDTVGADTDSAGNPSGDTGDPADLTAGEDGTEEEEGVTLDSLVDQETGGIPVYIVDPAPQEEERLIDEELGGVPVVIKDDLTAPASYAGSGGVSYQLPAYYVDYFGGVLANMPGTDYVSFCTRVYGGSGSYVEHYYLVYDISVDNGRAVSGSYPCLDIYRTSASSGYTVEQHSYSLASIPDFAFASFGLYSDLRKGVSHIETWTVLFFLGVAVVYSILHDIFDYVMGLRRR